MVPVGFEPTILASELPQTYALDRAATGTGSHYVLLQSNQEGEMVGICSTRGAKDECIQIWDQKGNLGACERDIEIKLK